MGTTKNQRMSLLFSGVLNVIVTKIHIYNMSTMMMQVNHMNQTPIVHGLQIHPHAQRPANRRIQESTQDPSRAFLQKMF